LKIFYQKFRKIDKKLKMQEAKIFSRIYFSKVQKIGES